MEPPQWLHVFIDVAPDVAEESASFWSAALGWPLGEPWPGLPEFRSFIPPEGDSLSISRLGAMALGSTLISKWSTVARLTGLLGWERLSPANSKGGAR